MIPDEKKTENNQNNDSQDSQDKPLDTDLEPMVVQESQDQTDIEKVDIVIENTEEEKDK